MQITTSIAVKIGLSFVSLLPVLGSAAPAALVSDPSIDSAAIQSAPTPPPGMKIYCPTGPNSPMQDAAVATCAVVVYNGVTFWPFAYQDNRVSVGLVGYDKNRMVSQQELPGSRYVWKAEVDASNRAIKFSGQANQAASVSWDDLAVMPAVVRLAISDAPKPPSNMKIACATGPNFPGTDDASTSCPVVRKRGIEFWPFSYIDNRSSLGLVGYKAGVIVSKKELVGARYAWNAVLNTQTQTVEFAGQGNQLASVAWANLPNVPVINTMAIQTGPTPPEGMKNFCTRDTYAYPGDNCPVIAYDDIEYWPFSYVDNRVAIGFVGYKSGRVVSQQEFSGARYTWRASVNTLDRSIQIVGQSGQQVIIPWDSLPNVPVVSMESVQSAPVPPAGLKVTCTTGPTSGAYSWCPVITYSGITFWPFSYVDNRVSLGLVGYKNGVAVSQQELVGTRYVWNVQADAQNQTVSFFGQANQVVSLNWANLR